MAAGQEAASDTDSGNAPEAVQNPAYVNKLLQQGVSFGTAFERDANRILRVGPDQSQSTPRYSFKKYAEAYFESALAPQNVLSSFAAAASGAAFHGLIHDSTNTGEFERRFAENMTRKSISSSIDFLTASLLKQDVRFHPSTEHGFNNRLKYAVLQTFIARGQEGNEIAVSRIAASFGTAAVLDVWNPWMTRKTEPNLFSHAGVIFGHYMARSIWTEFKPDIKQGIRTVLHRDTIFSRP